MKINNQIQLIAPILIFLFLLVSCLPSKTENIKELRVVEKKIEFPNAFYENALKLNGEIVAFTFDLDKKPSQRTSYVIDGDTNKHLFNPQNIENCEWFGGYIINEILPDGRIGFLGCGVSGKSYRSMFAMDWQTGKIEKLVNAPLSPDFSAKGFTWNPEMTEGVLDIVDGAQGTLAWISPTDTYPMDVVINIQGVSWNLRTYFENPILLRQGTGIARSPAWSPDGKTIAFFASTYGVNEMPNLAPSINYGVLLMNPVTQKPFQVISGITNAYRLKWSPNSKNLLFGGCMSKYKRCGLWVYRVIEDELFFVKEGDFQNFNWESNQSIIAIKNTKQEYGSDNEIWKYKIEDSLE